MAQRPDDHTLRGDQSAFRSIAKQLQLPACQTRNAYRRNARAEMVVNSRTISVIRIDCQLIRAGSLIESAAESGEHPGPVQGSTFPANPKFV